VANVVLKEIDLGKISAWNNDYLCAQKEYYTDEDNYTLKMTQEMDDRWKGNNIMNYLNPFNSRMKFFCGGHV